MRHTSIKTAAAIVAALLFMAGFVLASDGVPGTDLEKRIIIHGDSGQEMKYTDTRTFSGKVVTGPGKSLRIDASQAKLTVTGGTGNEVVVEAKVEAGSDDEAALRELLANTKLVVEPEGTGARVILRSPFEWNEGDRSESLSDVLRGIFKRSKVSFSYSAVVEIKVPASQSLDIENSFGDIAVSGVNGRHDIRNESGEIRVEGCGGSLRAETSFARIGVPDFKGDVDLTSESGPVDVRNVSGRADVRNSFAKVTFERIGGDLTVKGESSALRGLTVVGACRLESSFAEIDVRDVEKNLDIKGESSVVTVTDTRGDVTIETSFAPVKATKISGTLRVTAESSAVTAEDIGGKVEIVTSFNAVEVRRTGGGVKVRGESSPVLVENPGGDVDVTNSFGYVIVRGNPGSVMVRGESSSVELSAMKSLPEGSVVDVRTSFGPINITLPAGVEPRITTRVEFGRVRSEYPVYLMDAGEGRVRVDSREPQPESERVRGERGVVLVRLETSNGDIVIKKQ